MTVLAEAWANLVDYYGRYRRKPEHQRRTEREVTETMAHAVVEGKYRALVNEIEREKRLDSYWRTTVRIQMRNGVINGGRL